MSGMSTFYLPEKLAMFIPVFVTLELNTFNSPATLKRAIKRYLNTDIIPYFANNCEKLCEILNDETQVEAVKKEAYKALDLKQQGDTVVISAELLEDIEMMYDAGHTFYGWNFKNLTNMRHLSRDEYKGIEKFRNHLIAEIEDMYSFILPEDY